MNTPLIHGGCGVPPPAFGPMAAIPGAKMELILISTIMLVQHHSWGGGHIVH